MLLVILKRARCIFLISFFRWLIRNRWTWSWLIFLPWIFLKNSDMLSTTSSFISTMILRFTMGTSTKSNGALWVSYLLIFLFRVSFWGVFNFALPSFSQIWVSTISRLRFWFRVSLLFNFLLQLGPFRIFKDIFFLFWFWRLSNLWQLLTLWSIFLLVCLIRILRLTIIHPLIFLIWESFFRIFTLRLQLNNFFLDVFLLGQTWNINLTLVMRIQNIEASHFFNRR